MFVISLMIFIHASELLRRDGVADLLLRKDCKDSVADRSDLSYKRIRGCLFHHTPVPAPLNRRR